MSHPMANFQPVYRRLRCSAQANKPTTPVSPSASRPSLFTSSHLRTSRYSAPDSESSDTTTEAAVAKDMDKTEGEEAGMDDQSSNRLSTRERRRPKERRRGTGIWITDDDETGGTEEGKETWVSDKLVRPFPLNSGLLLCSQL